MSRSSCGKSDACFRSMVTPSVRLRPDTTAVCSEAEEHNTSVAQRAALATRSRGVIIVTFVLWFAHAIAAPNGEGYFVDNDVGAGIAQHEVTADESVLEIFRQVREKQEELRRHRRERVFFRVGFVDVDIDLAGAIVHDQADRGGIG